MSKIEWLARPDTIPESWNPATGCNVDGERIKTSPGCDNCWAERMARRLSGRFGYPEIPHHFDVTLHPDRLETPLGWRKPRTVFVCSMGDLFHDEISEEFLFKLLAITRHVQRLGRKHVFIILTKRAGRMAAFMSEYYARLRAAFGSKAEEPQKNLWLGVTVENEDNLRRVEHLLQTPAAVRFVSYEPALGPADLTKLEHEGLYYNALSYDTRWIMQVQPRARLDWVIAGGESGPHARPMHPDWARKVRDDCQAAGIPFHFKQWGAYVPSEFDHQAWRFVFQNGWVSAGEDNLWFGPAVYGKKRRSAFHFWGDDILSIRVGKKAAGRLLDGEEHSEWPK